MSRLICATLVNKMFHVCEIVFRGLLVSKTSYIYFNVNLFLFSFRFPGNIMYDNQDSLVVTGKGGQCLYRFNPNTSFPPHPVYRCHTCDTAEDSAICLRCVNTCHGGHAVEFLRRDRWVQRNARKRLPPNNGQFSMKSDYVPNL